MKNIAIIGGGVAGLSAAIYALRANAQVTMFEQYGLGGLVATIDKIENYPSYPSIDGFELANNMVMQAKQLGLKVVRRKVLSLTKEQNDFVVTTDKDSYTFTAVIVATGTSHNKLGIESDFVGKGVSYCATCDGNFYRNMPVAVVGNGKQAVREATYLADLCSLVHLIVPESQLNAEARAIDDLLAKTNVQIMYNATVSEIVCADTVSAIKVFANNSLSQIDVNGVFVAIGAKPITDFINIEGVEKQKGYLVVDDKCQTSVQGLYAAGDVTNGPLKQIVTACGDGAKAAVFACAYAGARK
ncbi:MAG: FAD-dependent oxidoreductase [Clostridia bacterium]|nr:FAD-dependent oxidoreductase [Clostridia bacterium]MBQ8505428.1 FAD-dependent oxidoreductase [Clostridia bacterium]